MNSFVRRVGKYAATAAGMSAAGRWLKKKAGGSVDDDPNPGSAQWPPLPGLSADDMATLEATSLEDRVQTSIKDTGPESNVDSAATDSADSTADSAGESAESAGAWIDPYDSGACPLSHPVKVKLSSGIYHVEGGRFYERTRANRCYLDADSAEADGFRAAKS